MAAKMSLLSALAVGTASLLTWSGFEAHKNQEYNKKMWEYGQWREEFFKKPNTNELMCQEKKECSNGKEYLPKPNEDHLWEKAYTSFLSNFEINHYENIKDLKNIDDLEKWKDYCYGEIKKDLDNTASFNPSGPTLAHEYCVLGLNELKQ